MREKINQWCIEEYGCSADFRDVFAVPIAYTTSDDGNENWQVYYDLVNNILYRDVDGKIVEELETDFPDDWSFEDFVYGGWK